MLRLIQILIMFVGVFCLSAFSWGDVFTVDDDGPANFSTIQAAINNCGSNDTIIVAQGIYLENINFLGKNITLTGSNPYSPSVIANTIINGGGNGSTVYFNGSENSNCTLTGFTITGGSGTIADGIHGMVNRGGGILGGSNTANTHATISKCLITGNEAVRGGGLAFFSGRIEDSVISNNNSSDSAPPGGGGGFADCASPNIYSCVISGNNAGYAGGGLNDSGGTIFNSLIVDNQAGFAGGGINQGGGRDSTIINCTFMENTAQSGSAIYNATPATSITNSIIWDTTTVDLFGNASPTIEYSCIKGDYLGTGNIDADPLFVTGPFGDYYLSQIASGQLLTSPCVDSGNQLASLLNLDQFTTRTDSLLDTGIVDMGYHYIPEPCAFLIMALGGLVLRRRKRIPQS